MGAAQVAVLAVAPLLALVLLVLRAATREDVAVDALAGGGGARTGASELASTRVVGTTVRLSRVLPWVAAAAGVQALRSADPEWAASVLRPGGGVVVTSLLGACVAGLLATTWGSADRVARVALVALALGAGANLLATATNGGMPFEVAAARAAGIPEAHIAEPPPGHVAAGEGTRLVALADVFPVPGAGVVFSAGDVLLSAGAAGLLVALVATPRRPGDPAGEIHPDTAPAVTERRSS